MKYKTEVFSEPLELCRLQAENKRLLAYIQELEEHLDKVHRCKCRITEEDK